MNPHRPTQMHLSPYRSMQTNIISTGQYKSICIDVDPTTLNQISKNQYTFNKYKPRQSHINKNTSVHIKLKPDKSIPIYTRNKSTGGVKANLTWGYKETTREVRGVTPDIGCNPGPSMTECNSSDALHKIAHTGHICLHIGNKRYDACATRQITFMSPG